MLLKREIAPKEQFLLFSEHYSLRAISPLYHNIILPIIKFSSLNKVQILISR